MSAFPSILTVRSARPLPQYTVSISNAETSKTVITPSAPQTGLAPPGIMPMRARSSGSAWRSTLLCTPTALGEIAVVHPATRWQGHQHGRSAGTEHHGLEYLIGRQAQHTFGIDLADDRRVFLHRESHPGGLQDIDRTADECTR
jgi:hypothetical protein